MSTLQEIPLWLFRFDNVCTEPEGVALFPCEGDIWDSNLTYSYLLPAMTGTI